MHTGVIIQARMNSTRLPGKILKPLPYGSDTAVLQQVIRRAGAAGDIGPVVVATTVNGADDPVAGLAAKEGAGCFRGPEDDVLERYYRCAAEYGMDLIVRITGDCPCVDPRVIERVVCGFCQAGCDYASNTLERSFPRGLDVEAFGMDALRKARAAASRPYEREHVTPFFYQNTDMFRCLSIRAADSENNPGIRITLDTYEDYMLICSVYDYFGGRAFGAGDVVGLFKSKPWLFLINKGIKQKSM